MPDLFLYAVVNLRASNLLGSIDLSMKQTMMKDFVFKASKWKQEHSSLNKVQQWVDDCQIKMTNVERIMGYSIQSSIDIGKWIKNINHREFFQNH